MKNIPVHNIRVGAELAYRYSVSEVVMPLWNTFRKRILQKAMQILPNTYTPGGAGIRDEHFM